MRLDRRALLAGLPAAAFAPAAFGQTAAKVAVIGGGFGGATAARTLKRIAPELDVTLIEANAEYLACPFSNLVLGGLRDMAGQRFAYAGPARDGVHLVQARAEAVDAAAKTITLADGAALSYDRLILSPGVDIRWGALAGYDEAAAEPMPHAWKAGPQTALLRRQLNAMADGGLVVMTAPRAPYRCPPGPYERASLIAHYLKTEKPASKLLILDAKDDFSKKPLFLQAWSELYPDTLEWRGASADGRVSRVDPQTMTIETDFEAFQADVANIIPPQKASAIAERAGVADATGWCPIDAVSFESTLQPGVHVIGDATIAAPMPKSAFSANLQGKICAIQVARLLADLPAEPTLLANTCYSFVAPDAAVSVSGVYANGAGAFAEIPGAGGVSPLIPEPGGRAEEAAQARDWYAAITAEAFG
ncbi:MAG: NAD(P)/FAD-dependent oxidoreductase [Pseudomonadota bacterium]